MNNDWENDSITDSEWQEILAYEEREGELTWELCKTVDKYIHSMEYLTFHEKTWLYMSRNNMTANELAKKLNVSKYVLSKCRANPANNWELAKKLIDLCEEAGLPCERLSESYRQQS